MRKALLCPCSPSEGKNPDLGSTSSEAEKASFAPNVSTSHAKLSACHSAVSGSTSGLRPKGHMVASLARGGNRQVLAVVPPSHSRGCFRNGRVRLLVRRRDRAARQHADQMGAIFGAAVDVAAHAVRR